MAERFDVPFSTLGKRAVREKWQRSVPPNGNKDGNNNTVFPEIGNKNGNKSGNKNGNKHGNSEVLFPSNGNRDGNKTAVFPEIGNKIGNKHGNSEVLFPKNGNNNGNKTAVFPEIGNKIGNSEALFPSNNTLAAKNGSAWKDPAAKSGSKNGSNSELAAKNGSAGNDPAAKSGSKNGSNTELAAKNGSAGNDPAAKSGSAGNDSAAKSGSNSCSKNGSSFDIPADINEWDRLTAALFYLKQFHWGGASSLSAHQRRGQGAGQTPPVARLDAITRPPM